MLVVGQILITKRHALGFENKKEIYNTEHS
jgi:hypothetical protein